MQTTTGLDAAAVSLRAWLNRQHFTDLTAREVTQFLTRTTIEWAAGLNYHARREVRLPARPDHPHAELLDLRLKHRSGKGRPISIEIDRGNKLHSLNKLVRAAELGDHALWLRWSHGHVPIPIPPTVRLIRAHVLRRRTPTGSNRISLQAGDCG
ncbi:hypothetical protein CP967_00015 [Streptomyces nitrosporeus]|uniref:Uncharacterized protein n=1 Tax=Streptomyces nitrosporeus TaxID=28894 RepID=A0A5J6F436_9ACTN|nr:hypothetical protein [Streptomyces nitrosporeus]QEU70564.1 hypothetical protein CP967_00015 [Streptomyces nitrosporeus]GGZ30156.1 hypothetical protein GCM10010327_70480 [Streptomyces nitrosporeus]